MQEKNIETFKSDIIENGSYQYSNTKKLSSLLSSTRTSNIIHETLGCIKGKK